MSSRRCATYGSALDAQSARVARADCRPAGTQLGIPAGACSFTVIRMLVCDQPSRGRARGPLPSHSRSSRSYAHVGTRPLVPRLVVASGGAQSHDGCAPLPTVRPRFPHRHARPVLAREPRCFAAHVERPRMGAATIHRRMPSLWHLCQPPLLRYVTRCSGNRRRLGRPPRRDERTMSPAAANGGWHRVPCAVRLPRAAAGPAITGHTPRQ